MNRIFQFAVELRVGGRRRGRDAVRAVLEQILDVAILLGLGLGRSFSRRLGGGRAQRGLCLVALGLRGTRLLEQIFHVVARRGGLGRLLRHLFGRRFRNGRRGFGLGFWQRRGLLGSRNFGRSLGLHRTQARLLELGGRGFESRRHLRNRHRLWSKGRRGGTHGRSRRQRRLRLRRNRVALAADRHWYARRARVVVARRWTTTTPPTSRGRIGRRQHDRSPRHNDFTGPQHPKVLPLDKENAIREV